MLRVSALPSLALQALPTAVAQFLKTHENVKFDLQTVHHDDLLRKLFERETDIAIAYEVPPAAPIDHRRLGEGELVVLLSRGGHARCAAALDMKLLKGHRSSASRPADRSGSSSRRNWSSAGHRPRRRDLARTFYIAAALVQQGVGMTVVDSFTAQASLAPGLAMRPLKPPMTFGVHAMYLLNRPLTALATDFLKTLRR
jgi:DNA-binding transcriptional LysR family regulator